MALRFVPESSDRAGRGLDLAGQVTAIVGLAALTYAFIEANTYGWTSARILTSFIVAGVSLAAFLVIEVRGKTPLLQLKFFRDLTFSGANLVGVIVSFGFFSVVFFLSLFMQNVQGYSPTRAGALQLPTTLGVMAAAIVSGRIVGRIGSRLPITLGLVMAGIGLLFLTGVQPDTPYSAFWYWLMLMGLGIGLIMSPMTSAIMGTVPPAARRDGLRDLQHHAPGRQRVRHRRARQRRDARLHQRPADVPGGVQAAAGRGRQDPGGGRTGP